MWRATTVEPLYSGHCWGMAFWLLYGGGCYTEVVLHAVECGWDQGCWPLYCRWLLLMGDRYEGFHCIYMYMHAQIVTHHHRLITIL